MLFSITISIVEWSRFFNQSKEFKNLKTLKEIKKMLKDKLAHNYKKWNKSTFKTKTK